MTAASRTLRPGDHNAIRAAIFPSDVPSTSGHNVNNNNSAWKAWLGASRASQSQPALSAPTQRPLLYDTPSFYDQDLDAQVRQIIESTPHQLKGNVPSGIFPFKYVTRGAEKRKLSFNTLTLPEHILGMFRIIDDVRVDPAIKPDILSHMREVAEDACEFDWQNHICRWSEEVFDLVAEGRIPGGWSAHAKFQNLRTGMSRVDSARISHARDSTPRDQVNHQRFPAPLPAANTSNTEVFKGSPPCPSFNSSQGCALPSGHVVHGKKEIHVCSYCLANTTAAHPHSESQCRIKQSMLQIPIFSCRPGSSRPE